MSLDRDKTRNRRSGAMISVLLAANAEIFDGSLVSSIAGYAKAATLADGGVILGIAKKHIKNQGADGDISAECERGIYQFNVNGAALNIGDIAYAYDDDTVTSAATTTVNTTTTKNSVVGKVFDIERDGSVWVDLR
jgi:hypothetical protein